MLGRYELYLIQAWNEILSEKRTVRTGSIRILKCSIAKLEKEPENTKTAVMSSCLSISHCVITILYQIANIKILKPDQEISSLEIRERKTETGSKRNESTNTVANRRLAVARQTTLK